MLKPIILVALVLIPQVAVAADMSPTHRHRHARHRHSHYVERNNVIHCTTTKLGLFSYADCGQVFDPLGIAAF